MDKVRIDFKPDTTLNPVALMDGISKECQIMSLRIVNHDNQCQSDVSELSMTYPCWEAYLYDPDRHRDVDLNCRWYGYGTTRSQAIHAAVLFALSDIEEGL